MNLREGSLVWAATSKNARTLWPGMIFNSAELNIEEKKGVVWIFWLGDDRVSCLRENLVHDFSSKFITYYKGEKKAAWILGVTEALKLEAIRRKTDITEHKLVEWALNGFEPTFPRDSPCYDYDIPSAVKNRLRNIAAGDPPKNNDKEIKRRNGLDVDTPKRKNKSHCGVKRSIIEDSEAIMKCKSNSNKTSRSVKKCFACWEELDIKKMLKHPLFEGDICASCMDNLKDTTFSLGEDDIHIHCAICAKEGKVFICDNEDCRRVYCITCLERLCSPVVVSKIEKADPWSCFLCQDCAPGINSSIKARKGWKENIMNMFNNDPNSGLPLPNIPPGKKSLKVLSLFDGIATGFVALENLGFSVDQYYCSEIDEDAILVSNVNFGKRIIHLGPIESITSETIGKIGPIDLLLGGSPCNDLSIVNPARKGLTESAGTGILFFEYVRILHLLQLNQGNTFFWFFENVASMPKEYRTIMNRHFECEPSVVDAKYLSPQSRARFFWGNLPGLKNAGISAMNLDSKVNVASILTPYNNRVAVVEKMNTITTRVTTMRGKDKNHCPVMMNGKGDILWATEMEAVFGLPLHYTDCGYLSSSRRLKVLGRAWSVQVISHILRPLKDFYVTKTANDEKRD